MKIQSNRPSSTRAFEIVETALELSSAERSSYLETACPDPALREWVDSLLLSHKEAGTFLDEPALVSYAGVFGEDQEVWVGRQIGPYRLVEEIGEGGMGTVYRAIRADDQYQKQVAIKLVRTGFESRSSLARFQAERQILANLEHPNIARLLDGGTTDRGLPYFVMELVEGLPIDQYCDDQKLSVEERLRLFQAVCSAVQYAHQNLVVHRDLKPANILVTANGVPKLLDFGIAKMLDTASFPQEVEPTIGFLRLLTPEYASPEQITGQAISTASDVYSLGVVLYRLLTGHRPRRLDNLSPEAVARTVCETEPVRPSLAVSRVEDRSGVDGHSRVALTPEDVSSNRNSKPQKLIRQLSGDLDNVVLKALRKEPRRRYPSAEAFSEDVRRYLEGFPVSARADTSLYRAAKFARRHAAALGVSVGIVLLIIGGLTATVWQYRIARAERDNARRHFNDTRALANSLIFEVHDSISNLPGATAARKVIIDRAVQYLDSMAKESSGDYALQRELAQSYQRLGMVQGDTYSASLGDPTGALASFQKATSLWVDIAGANPNNVDDQMNVAYGHRVLGNMDAPPGAFENVSQALAISQQMLRTHPEVERVRRELQREYESLGGLEDWQGNYSRGLDYLNDALALAQERSRQKPQDQQLRAALAELSVKVGLDLARTGFRKEGLQSALQAVQTYRGLLTDEMDANGQRMLGLEEEVVGEILSMDGDLAGALGYYRASIKRINRLLAADPKNAVLRDDIGDEYAALGRTLVRTGKIAEGLSFLELASKLPRLDPESIATTHSWTAEALAQKGDVRGALAKAQEAISDFAKGTARGENQANASANQAAARIMIGSALMRLGKLEQANTEFRTALDDSVKVAAEGNEQAKFTVAEAKYRLGLLAATEGRSTEAREWYASSSDAWKLVRNPGAMTPNGWAFDGPSMVETELAGCHGSCK